MLAAACISTAVRPKVTHFLIKAYYPPINSMLITSGFPVLSELSQ